MAKNKQDEIIRTYVMLKSLRENIKQMTANSIPETYVREFHDVLDRLESSGIGVSEFRIPGSEIAPNVMSINTITGHRSYTAENYVEKTLILFKLDSIIGYFEIITSEKPRRIGFSNQLSVSHK